MRRSTTSPPIRLVAAMARRSWHRRSRCPLELRATGATSCANICRTMTWPYSPRSARAFPRRGSGWGVEPGNASLHGRGGWNAALVELQAHPGPLPWQMPSVPGIHTSSRTNRAARVGGPRAPRRSRPAAPRGLRRRGAPIGAPGSRLRRRRSECWPGSLAPRWRDDRPLLSSIAVAAAFPPQPMPPRRLRRLTIGQRQAGDASRTRRCAWNRVAAATAGCRPVRRRPARLREDSPRRARSPLKRPRAMKPRHIGG